MISPTVGLSIKQKDWLAAAVGASAGAVTVIVKVEVTSLIIQSSVTLLTLYVSVYPLVFIPIEGSNMVPSAFTPSPENVPPGVAPDPSRKSESNTGSSLVHNV